MPTRPSEKTYHVLNLGAGVQSTALYLMFMQRKIDIPLDAAIFADPQEESSDTYSHIEWLKSLGAGIARRSAERRRSRRLVKSTRGVALLPESAQNFLKWSVISRPLKGEVPAIDLVVGYRKVNMSPILRTFLSRIDDLTARISGKARRTSGPK